jgi:diadenosine tetraphosphate (Ap4A) HIT family hydrolase
MKMPKLSHGSIVRNRAHQRAYNTYRKYKTPGCQFCEFTIDLDHVLEEHKLFWIVRNLFPYHIWDGSRTGEHLMIVPKRHVDSIAHFTDEERVAYMGLLARYESTGYSIYLRASQSGRKTVAHQHTHLIQVGKGIKAQLFIERPHINITR